ncbi:Glutathione S-transferase F11 [Apostasia shenzhenica]|uniref:glutathione transferase n=1 Tax=Apostasia shenzhenica TaxID=1088818 RepID=A0A2I0AKF0_9ASPA|nr:Glutathione S-transferase F11 [Apostasia shenzhenica]
MAGVTVYGPAMSTAVSRVLACLLEKDVPFQLVAVDLAKAQHRSPDFLKIQAESRAICRYICDKYAEKGNKGLLGRKEGGFVERAWVEQWLEAESQNFNPPSSALVLQLALGPIEKNEGKLAKVLDVYERRLGESRFLAGDDFSLADLSHLPNCHYIISATDRGHLFASRKNVGRWWEEISSRPSWKKVVEMQSSPPS